MDGPPLIALLRALARDDEALRLEAFDERAVRWAIETGLGPLLRWALRHDGAAATSPAWPALQAADLTAHVVAADYLDAMAELLDACDGRIAPLVLLKGISVCTEYYPDPRLRPMRDIDVLAEPDDLPVVETALDKLGYTRRGQRSAAFYAAHHHGSPFAHAATGVWIEVHRALFPSRSELAMEPLFMAATLRRRLRGSEFRGRRVRRLRPELQLVYLACHWGREHRIVGGMVAMTDAILLLRHTRRFRWKTLVRMARDTVAARHLHLLLTYLARRRVLDIPHSVLERLAGRHTLSPTALAVVHWLIDRYVVDGREFGALVRKPTFNHLWNVLVLRRWGGDRVRSPEEPRPPRQTAEPSEVG